MSIWQPKSQRWSAMKHSSDGFWLMGTGLFEKQVPFLNISFAHTEV